MPITHLKLIGMAVILLTGLTGGILAQRLQKSTGAQLFFSLGSALAGGIFLGAGLIHLLPDGVQGFKDLAPHWEYPWAFLLCAAAFIAILCLEKVALAGKSLEEGGLSQAEQGAQPAPGPEEPSVPVYPYILMAALSFHSVLAGLAMGAEASWASSMAIGLAIVAHKGSAAFALVVGFLRGGLPRARLWGLLVVFSVMTPAGVALGWGFTSLYTGRAAQIFEAIFDCLAAGTFFYIAVLDIIQEEFFDPSNRWAKFALLLVGLIGMALLALWL